MKQPYPINNDQINKILQKYSLDNLESIKQLTQGIINSAYLINGKYILRISDNRNLNKVQGFDVHFHREAFLYPILRGLDIPTPVFLGLDDTKTIISDTYILLSFIEGDTLLSSFQSFDEDIKKNLTFQLGEVLRKIHSVPLSVLNNRKDLLGPRTNWISQYITNFCKYYQFGLSNQYLSQKEVEVMASTLLEFEQMSTIIEKKTMLVHGDFSPSNVLIREGQIVGILDFEWSHFGDPFWDLQKLPISFQIGDSFSVDNFLQGYGITTFTAEDKIRLKMHCFYQGLWELWATKTKLFPMFDEKQIEEGKDLIVRAIKMFI